MSRGFRVARVEITLEIDPMCQMPTCFVGTSTTQGHDCKFLSTMIPAHPLVSGMVTAGVVAAPTRMLTGTASSMPTMASAAIMHAAAMMHAAAGLRRAAHGRMRQAAATSKTATKTTRSAQLRTRCHRQTATTHRIRRPKRT